MKPLVVTVALWFAAAVCFGQSTYTWTGDLTKTKSYTFVLTLDPGPALKGEVWSDGPRVEKFSAPASDAVRQVEVPPIFLSEGPASLELRTKAGTLSVRAVAVRDSLRIHTDPIRSVPMDPLATPAAHKLLAFLVAESGRHILSGQQDLTWNDGIDMTARVKQITGKEPALMGYDFLNYVGASDGGNGRSQTEEALAWWNRGGLVAFCWHWRVGTQRQFYTNQTDFRIPATTDTAWESLDRDLAVVADELKKLQDAGVPVLWRPLHEASGGWFWWGASGPEPYKRLWNHVYDQLVHVHGLHNLLWVWNGQNDDWYPGDTTVDVVGWDIYGNDKEYYAYPDTWRLAQSVPRNEAKLVTLSENGPIPDPDLLVSQKVPWSWFMTWNDGDKGNPADDFFSGPKFMDDAFKKRVYNHPYVLTLDELPAWR
jgi:mannan endo-1,4-beta-mannosidase